MQAKYKLKYFIVFDNLFEWNCKAHNVPAFLAYFPNLFDCMQSLRLHSVDKIDNVCNDRSIYWMSLIVLDENRCDNCGVFIAFTKIMNCLSLERCH